MTSINFFKYQSNNFLKDYKTRVYNKNKAAYEYNPRYFPDIKQLLHAFGIRDDSKFSLMKAQHIVAKLSGFSKWNELITASEPVLEIGKNLLIYREKFQQKMGSATSGEESLIVREWKKHEACLAGCSDKEKWKIFQITILEQIKPRQKRASTRTVDFSNNITAQDMLIHIMRKTNLPPENALLWTLKKDIFINVIMTPWTDLAVSYWGHDDPNKKHEKLANPILKINLTYDQRQIIQSAMFLRKITFKKALTHFMIFALESLGYHI